VWTVHSQGREQEHTHEPQCARPPEWALLAVTRLQSVTGDRVAIERSNNLGSFADARSYQQVYNQSD
jgi:hypothetical protein